MKNIFALLLVVIGVYIPIDTWIAHGDQVASPLQYIGLGAVIYFWITVLAYVATPKNDRKLYSQNELNACLLAMHNETRKQLEERKSLDGEKEEGSLH